MEVSLLLWAVLSRTVSLHQSLVSLLVQLVHTLSLAFSPEDRDSWPHGLKGFNCWSPLQHSEVGPYSGWDPADRNLLLSLLGNKSSMGEGLFLMPLHIASLFLKCWTCLSLCVPQICLHAPSYWVFGLFSGSSLLLVFISQNFFILL